MTEISPSARGGTGSSILSAIAKRGDIALALGVIRILVVLLLPMPTWALDFLLALSMAFSVIILMAVMFIRHPLELNTFPTILLVATMLRLALNLASTRLILANGHTGTDAAGHVIEAFGNRSEEHTSELQSLMRISYAVFCLKKKKTTT